MIVRLLAGVAAVAVGVAAIALVAVLVHDTPGPVATTSATTVPAATTPAPPSRTSLRFPAPPPGAVVFTHQDVGTVLALAVNPGRRLGLQVSALGPSGKGTRGLELSFTVAGRSARGRPCGAGCYRASVPAPAHPKVVVVRVRGGGLDTVWRQRLPAAWPAPAASALVARAGDVWRSLHSLAFVEHLASDPQHAITSLWRVASPDQAAYQIVGGYAGIVIGDRRWDRAPGGRWIESEQASPITQPVPTWSAVRNAHLLGSGTVRGRPVWIVSFYDPSIPAWFKVAIEKATSRTVNVGMMATAHFMNDAYGAFDRARPITPP
ncbi:MAG TPA: hypothetical protein VH538_07180 [Gaiellaceae bacterium]